jgi:histidine kinase/DNA gyrase B/HSP90-like ATPase
LRSIGYSFEAAVADIIDNSIDAGARNILVRFVLQRDKPLDLAVWDDGDGMSEATLKEAMRFGADVNDELHRLGKFGLGLKGEEGTCLGKAAQSGLWAISPNNTDEVLSLAFEKDFGLLMDLSANLQLN